MEKKLNDLFDYQRFAQNEKLGKLIRETENRYARELSDDDLTLVNAAGEFEMGSAKITGNDDSSGGGGGGAGGSAAMSK